MMAEVRRDHRRCWWRRIALSILREQVATSRQPAIGWAYLDQRVLSAALHGYGRSSSNDRHDDAVLPGPYGRAVKRIRLFVQAFARLRAAR
jgi:hypothetical protein